MSAVLFFLRSILGDGTVLARSGSRVRGVDPTTLPTRQVLPFGQANVAAGDNATPASATPVLLPWCAAGGVGVGWVAPRAGSITALSAVLSAAAGGADLIVGVYKNGVLMDVTAIVTLTSAGGDLKARATFQRGAFVFNAGDVIDVRIRAGSGWTSTAADLGVAVEVAT